jgi:putative transposase
MANHVHPLATPSDETSVPSAPQSVGRRYLKHFNYAYRPLSVG